MPQESLRIHKKILLLSYSTRLVAHNGFSIGVKPFPDNLYGDGVCEFLLEGFWPPNRLAQKDLVFQAED